MTEQESKETLSPEWKEAIKQGIQDALDNYELLGQVNVVPASISGGLDERGFPELSLREQQFIAKILFSALGVANIDVFTTSRSDENMFLHVIHFPDGKVDFVVAPRDFRL